MRFTLVTCFLLAACSHDHDAEGFDTFQDCFDDHHEAESLPVGESIVICCLDHPIAGVSEVCGATAATCETYLATNLATTSATMAEVTAACTDYEMQKGM